MITLKVESGIGGEISQALIEMVRFARKLDICAQQTINGIIVLAFPNTDAVELHERYIRAVSLGFKVVS